MTENELTDAFAGNWAAVFRYCSFRLGSPQDAEDATSEVFVRLVRVGDRVRPEKRVSWLYAVARNVCTDIGRGDAMRRKEPAAPDDREVVPGPGPWVDPAVRRAVMTLTQGQQQVVFLRVFEDKTFAEIGCLLGRSETATRMQYHRAMRRLRKRLAVAEQAGMAKEAT